MAQMASSNETRKTLVGLRVIEAWCWLWAAVWLAAAASAGVGSVKFSSIAGGDALLMPALGIGMSGDEHGMIVFVASVCLGLFLISLCVAIGLRGRRTWARKITLSLSFLGILNALNTIRNGINSLTTNGGGGMALAEFHFPVLVLYCLVIYYLRQQDVEEAFGLS